MGIIPGDLLWKMAQRATHSWSRLDAYHLRKTGANGPINMRSRLVCSPMLSSQKAILHMLELLEAYHFAHEENTDGWSQCCKTLKALFMQQNTVWYGHRSKNQIQTFIQASGSPKRPETNKII